MLGFLDDSLSAISDSGCSPFFLTSSAMSVVTGINSRKQSIINAYEDQAFKKELEIKKEQYEDIKEAQDWAFKKWLKEQNRANARLRSRQKLNNELSKKELKQVFEDWPLKVSIESAIDKLTELNANQNLAVIIGKPKSGVGKDLFSIEYDEIVMLVRNILDQYATKRDCVFSFLDDNKVFGGAALATIFSCLSTYPAVMIQPHIINGKLHFIVNLWTADSANAIQNHAITIDWDERIARNSKEYLLKKKKDICLAISSIACIVNDIYRAIEFQAESRFPEMAKEYKITDGYLLDYAIKEYKSVLVNELPSDFDGNSVNALDYAVEPNVLSNVHDIINKTISTLQK